jgi:hypothetical protein
MEELKIQTTREQLLNHHLLFCGMKNNGFITVLPTLNLISIVVMSMIVLFFSIRLTMSNFFLTNSTQNIMTSNSLANLSPTKLLLMF